MWRGISLANKCLLLFGAAVVLIILAALSVPFLRMNAIVDDAQKDLSRKLVEVWERGATEKAGLGPLLRPGIDEQFADARITLATGEQVAELAKADPFVARGARLFAEKRSENELHDAQWLEGGVREYRYAKVVRDERGQMSGMVVLTRPSPNAATQMLVNGSYLFSAGLIAMGLALLVFYLITNRLILSPVRSLKETAELVREGNLTVRSDIHTGDEFEDLSEAFNQMLEGVNSSQDQLRAINLSLDLKVNELAERNVALFEANKVKGEFLANVSHELRTPLNSIIGFTELLIEGVSKEEQAIVAAAALAAAGATDGNAPGGATTDAPDAPKLAKRRRYLENIHNSGRSLLELINGLLEMAKAEAGKMELRIEQMNVKDSCEGLLALIRPLADRAGVELVLDVSPDVPEVETDASKFQQIIFNLLSNAVKFTGEKAADERASGQVPIARVTLRAERLFGRASDGLASEDLVRVSVLDTGPGISQEDQGRIFQKFQQLDTGHTRRHAGTGLGLAICRELSTILQCEIQVESETGRGAMFSVLLPLKINPERAQAMKLEMASRAKGAA